MCRAECNRAWRLFIIEVLFYTKCAASWLTRLCLPGNGVCVHADDLGHLGGRPGTEAEGGPSSERALLFLQMNPAAVRLPVKRQSRMTMTP